MIDPDALDVLHKTIHHDYSDTRWLTLLETLGGNRRRQQPATARRQWPRTGCPESTDRQVKSTGWQTTADPGRTGPHLAASEPARPCAERLSVG